MAGTVNITYFFSIMITVNVMMSFEYDRKSTVNIMFWVPFWGVCPLPWKKPLQCPWIKLKKTELSSWDGGIKAEVEDEL